MDPKPGRNDAETRPDPGLRRFLDFTLDSRRQLLLRGTASIRLRPQTYDVLSYLVSQAGRLVSKRELVEAVWGEVAVTDDSLVQCLMEIRRALGDSHDVVKTVRGRGYIFDAAVRDGVEDDVEPVRSTPQRRFPAWRAAGAVLVIGIATIAVLYSGRLGHPASGEPTRALAREIAGALRVELTREEQKRLAGVRHSDPETYEAFLKGRYYWSKRTEDTTRKAIEHFQHAIDRDPRFALAFIGLADAYTSLAVPETLQEVLPPDEAFPKARAAIGRALEIDDTLADAHASLAHILFQYDRDWSGAEQRFKRAIALNPNYANAHHWYALSLVWMGRYDEALSEIRQARAIDPLSLVINSNLGFILAVAGQYDGAIEQCRKTIDMEPNFAHVRYRLGQIYVLRGMPAKAIVELKQAIVLAGESPRATAELALAHAQLGDRNTASQLLAWLRARSKARYVSPFNIALIYAGLGENEQALGWLEIAHKEHAPSLNFLTLSPAFVRLHSEPRFTALVQRIGLPPL